MKTPATLDETIAMMISDDFTIRLKAEYYQLRIRQKDLESRIEVLEGGGVNDEVTRTLRIQYSVMSIYAEILEQRANSLRLRL